MRAVANQPAGSFFRVQVERIAARILGLLPGSGCPLPHVILSEEGCAGVSVRISKYEKRGQAWFSHFEILTLTPARPLAKDDVGSVIWPATPLFAASLHRGDASGGRR